MLAVRSVAAAAAAAARRARACGATRAASVSAAAAASASGGSVAAPPATPAGRAAALAAAIKQIEASFGKGAIMHLGGAHRPLNIDVVPTGSLALDAALGIGGLPFGRVVELYGPESSGKTTLALHVVAEAQKMGKTCAFVDAEHALDIGYAAKLGVRIKDLMLSQPDMGEQALEITDVLVRSGGVDVVVIDSVAALVPRVEIEGEMGDQHMALQARLMSQALRKLTASLSRSKTLIIFLNQIRQKVGVMFGSPDVTPGGNALKFYSSVRMEIRRAAPIKKGEEVIGNLTRVKVVKNKMAPPFRVAEFDMMYGVGISQSGEAVDVGVTAGVFSKSGAWYAVTNAEVLAAVNAAAAGGAATAAAPVESAPAPAPAPAPAKRSKKKGAAEVDAAPAPAHDAAAPAPAAPAPAPAAPPSAAKDAVKLGEPFIQGKEKMKAYLEAHPAVLEVAIRVVRTAMKDPKLRDAALAASLAGDKPKKATKAAAAAADDDDGATVLGSGDDDDDAGGMPPVVPSGIGSLQPLA